MAIKLTAAEALRLRMHGLRLSSPQVADGDIALAVSRQAAGLQAQDLFAATLGVRVRAPGSALAEVERSRLADRTVVRTWLMRGTLHLVPSEDLGWLLAVLGSPLIAATAQRRDQLGLDEATYAAGLRAVRTHLADAGPSTREELGQVLVRSGLPHGYSIERHLLFRAALEGVICMGPDRRGAPGAHPTFVLLADWLGASFAAPAGSASPAATTALAARYLAAFAPATPADFSAWSGLNVRDLRAGWEALASRLVEVEVEGRPAWLPAFRLAELDLPPPASPHVRLLPAFDTYLLGHRSRVLIDDGAYAARIKGGGMLPASVLVDGHLRGTWQTNRKGRRVAITVDPFAPFTPDVDAVIAQEIADIERFLSGIPHTDKRAILI